MQKRCPWCGKKVQTRGITAFKTVKRKTPASFAFLKCPNCDNYFGQNYKSKLSAVCVVISLLSLGFLFLKFGLILTLATIAAMQFIMINSSLVRMTENEEFIKADFTIYKAECSGKRLRKNHIYLTDQSFDESSAFGSSSPIRITKTHFRSKEFEFYFLYDNAKNEELLSKPSFEIFDDNIRYIINIIL